MALGCVIFGMFSNKVGCRREQPHSVSAWTRHIDALAERRGGGATHSRHGSPLAISRDDDRAKREWEQSARAGTAIEERVMSVAMVPIRRSGDSSKIVSSREAVRLIRPGDTVAIGGFFGIGLALEVIHELGAVYEVSDDAAPTFDKPHD